MKGYNKTLYLFGQQFHTNSTTTQNIPVRKTWRDNTHKWGLVWKIVLKMYCSKFMYTVVSLCIL